MTYNNKTEKDYIYRYNKKLQLNITKGEKSITYTIITI